MQTILKTCAIFLKIYRGLIFAVGGADVKFMKNDQGEVTAILRHMAGQPDSEAKKLKNK